MCDNQQLTKHIDYENDNFINLAPKLTDHAI
jgi:hypothetical protein